MFHEVVMPIINFMTAQIPRDLQKTGLINGPVFDSISFGVVTIKGKKHFRISGFSGVDLTAIFKDCVVDLNHLLADVTFKVSTGFGLSDLTAEGTTPLKDMLNAKVELNVSWHVKMAEVGARMAIRLYELNRCGPDVIKNTQGVLSGCKFFQAQRSLVFFQFESIFHVVSDLIKTMGLPELFQKLEEMCGEMGVGPLFDAPPSLEQVDAVLDAVGGITGKTFGSLRKHFLSDVNGPEAMTFLAMFKKFVNQKLVEKGAAKTRNSPFNEQTAATKWALEGIGLYFQAQETLSGFEGVKVISKIHQMGLRLKGLGDFFKLLPSKAEYDAAKVPKREEMENSDGFPIPRFTKYARFLSEYLEPGRGPAQPERPSDEYLNELREDFSEIVDIFKAAIPYLDHFQRNNIPQLGEEHGPALVDKAEKEAKWMFGLIDEDAAGAAFDQAVADGFVPEKDDDNDDCESKYCDPSSTQVSIDMDDYDQQEQPVACLAPSMEYMECGQL